MNRLLGAAALLTVISTMPASAEIKINRPLTDFCTYSCQLTIGQINPQTIRGAIVEPPPPYRSGQRCKARLYIHQWPPVDPVLVDGRVVCQISPIFRF